jgi:hypothetical protein
LNFPPIDVALLGSDLGGKLRSAFAEDFDGLVEHGFDRRSKLHDLAPQVVLGCQSMPVHWSGKCLVSILLRHARSLSNDAGDFID